MEFEESVLAELKTVKDRVRFLLERFPLARNSDTYLFILYWKYFVNLITEYVPWKTMMKAATPSTIRTARQQVQNEEGLYPPTDPKVLRRRQRKREAYRRALGRREI